ncbi:MAG: hypothetical protein IPM42_10625 [Saprospiraceae bacterium]|nr:hypothetical protein [Saprospiraceae bacterium]
MNKNIQKIIPGVGLGDLKFGLTRDEVTAMIGKPDDVENLPGFDEEVNDQLESWHYDEHEFSLVFDADYDWRLVSIAVSDPYFQLDGHNIVGMNRETLQMVLDNLGIEVSNEEDISDEDNPDMQLIESEESGLMIWFDEGEVIEIQILPDVDEDGESLIWPQ